jgi:hypothetical protein
MSRCAARFSWFLVLCVPAAGAAAGAGSSIVVTSHFYMAKKRFGVTKDARHADKPLTSLWQFPKQKFLQHFCE